MKKCLVKKNEMSIVDPNTGEIQGHINTVEVVPGNSEPFFLTYSKEIMALYGKSIFNATTKVFWKLLEFAEYNTGYVYMTSVRRNEIMDVCQISRPSYDRAVRELVEAGIITKDGNTYCIDSNMFWKGDRHTRERLKEAKMKISFTPIFNPEEEQ